MPLSDGALYARNLNGPSRWSRCTSLRHEWLEHIRYWRAVKRRRSADDTSGTRVSPLDSGGVAYAPDIRHMEKARARECQLADPVGLQSCSSGSRAADLSREGLDEMQGTRTLRQAHTKAPAVAAMTRTSLRLGAFVVFPRRSERGHTPTPDGGEME